MSSSVAPPSVGWGDSPSPIIVTIEGSVLGPYVAWPVASARPDDTAYLFTRTTAAQIAADVAQATCA
ncbi:hypothetical protein [Streptomyces chartreusis]|uniref:hypothetical protein n=1 Tax=Streptomyces chartreusis TaxID=1969 RepID=UPI0037FAE6C6